MVASVELGLWPRSKMNKTSYKLQHCGEFLKIRQWWESWWPLRRWWAGSSTPGGRRGRGRGRRSWAVDQSEMRTEVTWLVSTNRSSPGVSLDVAGVEGALVGRLVDPGVQVQELVRQQRLPVQLLQWIRQSSPIPIDIHNIQKSLFLIGSVNFKHKLSLSHLNLYSLLPRISRE